MPTKEQLEKALINADAAGDTEAAKILANELKKMSGDGESYLAKVGKNTLESAKNVAESWGSIGDIALTMGAGTVAEPVAGLAGIAGAITGGPEQGAQNVDSVRGMAYSPKMDLSGQRLNAMADTLKPVTDFTGAVDQGLREMGGRAGSVFGEKGGATGAAVGSMILPAGGLALGGGLSRVTPPQIPKIPKLKKPKIVRDYEERKEPTIEDVNEGNIGAADYEIGPDGKIRKSKVNKDMQYQGMDPLLVSGVRAAKPQDKNYFREMVSIVEKGRKNWSARALEYPSQVPGRNIAQRYNHVRKQNKEAGKLVGSVAEKVLPGIKVDYGPAVESFLSDIKGLGVKFDPATGKIDFSGSTIYDIAPNEGTVRRVLTWMRDKDPASALSVHELKRYLDENISYGKKPEGATESVQRVLRDFRSELNQLLKDASPEYAKANLKFSETREAMEAIEDAAGSKIDFDSDTVDRALGIEFRKILSNYAKGDIQLNSLKILDEMANKYGGRFNDDIVQQVQFYVELQRLFPQTFRTTFSADVAKGVEAALKRGPVEAFKDATIEKGIEAVRGARNEEEALKALKRLLSEPTPGPQNRAVIPMPPQ